MGILKLKKRYERYPEYKDSGVEWLGEIPAEWNLDRLKIISDINKNTLPENTKPDFVFKYFDISSVEENTLFESTEEIEFSMAPSRARRIIKSGDTIIATVRTYLKAVFHFSKVTSPVIVSTGFAVLSPSKKILPKFLYYFIRSNFFIDKIVAWSKGVSYPAITPYDLGMLELIYPSFREQESIANYLDEKTALIDQIIEKKQKQIELLREKRTAIINQAVTKGLNPNVEFVDSGIDWIGRIPKGWEMKKIKHVAEVLPSNVDKLIEEGEATVRLCNYTDVYKNERITLETVDDLMIASASKIQIKKLSLLKDDVIITKDSETPDDIGIPAYVPKTLPGVVCGYHLAIIRPTHISGDFLARFFQTQIAKTQFFLLAKGLTRYGLGIGDISGTTLPTPPENEQVEIARFLEEKILLFDKAIDFVMKSIEALQEFKSSLISNVATGKIKI